MDDLLARVDALGRYLDIPARQARLDALEQRRLDPAFWNDRRAAREVEQQVAAEKDWLDAYRALARRRGDLAALEELVDESGDADLRAEMERERAALEREVEALELRG